MLLWGPWVRKGARMDGSRAVERLLKEMGWSKATEGCGAACLGPGAVGGVWNEHQLEGGPCTKVESAEVEARHAECRGGEDEEENSLENGGFQSPCLITKSCLTLCHPINYSTPGFPVLHHLPKFAQTHVHWVGDTIQPSHPLSPPSPPAYNLSQHQGLFPVSCLFTSGGQSIGVSASASVLPMNIQGWFSLGLTGLISLLSKGLPRVFSNTTVQNHQFFSAQPFLWSSSHPYMTTGKTIALTARTFVNKVISLLLNMLSRFVIAFLPRSKCLLISWLQSPSAVIWEPKNKFSHCFHCFPIYLPWSDGTGCHDLHFLNAEF